MDSNIFEFKQKSHDFYVTENLPFALKGKGDALYVFFEKRNKTTNDIINHLRKRFKISRMTLGIAGLKDKKAIAKQWISIYDRALKKLGGEKVFVEALGEIVNVMKVGRHTVPLNMSTPITNTFHIVLKSTKNLGQEERNQAKEIVENMMIQGYPNIFGDQRFGINGRNSTQGWEIISGETKEKFTKSEAIFKLQAYSSKVFNEYAEKRIANNKDGIDGDILTWQKQGTQHFGIYEKGTNVVKECAVKGDGNDYFFTPELNGKEFTYDSKRMIVTGPIPGFNTPIPNPTTESGKRESSFLMNRTINDEMMEKHKEFKVFGLRRAIWVYPTDTKVKYNNDDLIIDFTLPAGSYASIVFDKLLEALK